MTLHQESTGSVGGIHEVHLVDRDKHHIDSRRSTELASRRAVLQAAHETAEQDWAFMLEAIGEHNADRYFDVLNKFQADIDKTAQKLTAIEAEIAAVGGTVPVIS